MPSMNLDVVDAAELAELLQFLSSWTASDPARLAPSLLAFVGHPTSRPIQLQPVTRNQAGRQTRYGRMRAFTSPPGG